MSDGRDARSSAGPEEAQQHLWSGIERCRALVDECKSALEEGTAEPSIFGWEQRAPFSHSRHNGLDRDR